MTDKQFETLVNRRNFYQNKIDEHVKELIKELDKTPFLSKSYEKKNMRRDLRIRETSWVR